MADFFNQLFAMKAPEIPGQQPDLGQPSPVQPDMSPVNPLIGEMVSAQDEMRKSGEDADSFTKLFMKGLAEAGQGPEKLTKGQVARNALANFARANLMGPNFRSVEQEAYERRMDQQKAKMAQLGMLIQAKRAQSAEANNRANQLRLLFSQSQNEQFRRDRLAFDQEKEFTRAKEAKDRRDLSERYFKLNTQKADNQADYQDRLATVAELQAKFKSPDLAAVALAQERYGEDATVQQIVDLQKELAKDFAKIRSAERRPPTIFMSAPGTNGFTPYQAQGVQALAKDINADKNVDIFNRVRNAYTTIRDAANNSQGGPDDVALLRQYAILLDPQTGVREEEYNSMKGAAGLRNSVNLALSGKWAEGERLTPEARKQFLSIARRIYNNRLKTYDEATSRYRNTARIAYGIENPDEVLQLQQYAPENEPESKPAPGNTAPSASKRMLDKVSGGDKKKDPLGIL